MDSSIKSVRIQKRKKITMKKRQIPYSVCVGMALIILVVIRMNFAVVKISGTSMEPTLKEGAYVFVNKIASIQRGDIVLALDPSGQYIVKRVVALAGDQIHITSNSVIVNGTLYDSVQNHSSESYDVKLEVPDNSVFLLGDNRMESIDSRMYGCISAERIYGVVWGGTK